MVRTVARIALSLAALSCLCSPASTAQETRPITVWVDTLTRNVCATGSFQVPIRVASFRQSDTVVGFKAADYVASATLYVTWDPSTLDLDDFVLTSGTMSDRIKTVVRKYPDDATLEILLADDHAPYGILSGNQPLLYLSGRVKAPDTVAGLNGWIRVTDVELTSDTRFTPEIFLPGFVRVVRDTTAAYTGRVAVSTGTFDSLRIDTVTVSVENVRSRRVREISFSLETDPSFFVFVDTLQSGTMSSQALWSSVEVTRTESRLTAHFTAPADLASNGPLVKVILRRTVDSAFESALRVTDAAVNSNSCLGRFGGAGSLVTAAPVPAPTGIAEEGRRTHELSVLPVAGSHDVVVRTGGDRYKEVRVVDAYGRRVELRSVVETGDTGYRLTLGERIASGVYFVQLRSGNEQVSKQFIFIQ